MERHYYVVLTTAHPGREAEMERWYDEQHLADVARVPGVVSAKRFHMSVQRVTGMEAQKWSALAIYEIESDDPVAVMDMISDLADSEVMPLSKSLNRKVGLVQIIAQLSSSIEKS